MYNLIFNNKHYNQKRQLFLALFFTIFTIFALSIDSVYFQQKYFDGRLITNALVVIYLFILFYFSDIKLKKLLFVMIFLSYLGELIFCEYLQMYHYKLGGIPLYIPFGHAIVYGSGYILACTKWAKKHDLALKKTFTIFYILLFLLVGIFLNDVFSLISGCLFFIILKRKKFQNLYYFLAFCAIFVELVGTFFKCWHYESITFGIIPTANPPVGAVFIYAGGDVLLAKIVSYWRD